MDLFTLIIENPKDTSIPWLFLTNAPGAFLGALFAFVFFIVGTKWKTKYDVKNKWKKIYRKEHAYLERYLYNLRVILIDNKRILKVIVESYNDKEINMLKLADLPIREDSSMKIDDLLFMNRLEIYIGNDLKRLNLWQNGMNAVQNKINENLVSVDKGKKEAAEKNLKSFIDETNDLIKQYNYLLDAVDDLIMENRILLKKYKKWKYNNKKVETTFAERKKEIEREKGLKNGYEEKNPLKDEMIARLQKFGIKTEK